MIFDMPMCRLLQSYGAKETPKFRTKESRLSHLIQLKKEAERCVEEFEVLNAAAAAGNMSLALAKEKEKELTLWKRREKLLSRMKAGFEKIRLPSSPFAVFLEVVGMKALRVKFMEPEITYNPEAIITKYKVEWSMREGFEPLTGSRELMNLQKLEMVISEVTHGIPYYIRVAAGNGKGYGPYTTASPPFAVPSSWRDVDGKRSRALGRLCQLDCIFHQIIFSRPPYSSEIKELLFSHTMETPQQQRRQVRKSIKNLFTLTPKFLKNMKRGVYLACLLYNDHRVLVTTEDVLPIMEVDDTCPSGLHTDFHWMMKVACTWEDTKSLRMEMEKSHSSSTVHFRSKLLQTAEMMQGALGIQDLGQFYYKPLKDSEDTTVLCTVKYVPDIKSMTNLSIRWMPLTKLQRKLSISSNIGATIEVFTANSMLLSSTQSMMAYNHVSRIPLPKGLYVAYVKISASVDLIRVLVPKKAPNVLPYYRIRENTHLSREEWDWVKNLGREDNPSEINPSDTQMKFQRALYSATKSLLSLLEVPLDQIGAHRIYDAEVVELNPDVSLILLLPPVESFCSAPGQKDDVTDRDDCILLPVQIFEMIHMMTYQQIFISKYSRISSILEMDTVVANHFHRQAFSENEVSSTRARLRQLQEFQSQVDNTWRAMRWLMDVLNFAREKQPALGISLDRIFVDILDSPDFSPTPSTRHSPICHTLQVPCEIPGVRSSVDRSPDTITIKITTSSSSFSLTEATMDDKLLDCRPPTEMRRCASTSGLMQVASAMNIDNPFEQSPSSLGLTVDEQKSVSTLCISTNFEKPDNQSEVEIELETAQDKDEVSDSIAAHNIEKSCSQEGIVIHVFGSSRSLSSNNTSIAELDEDAQNADLENRTDAGCYSRIFDESNHDSSDESVEDNGLQFRSIVETEKEDFEEDIKFFNEEIGEMSPEQKEDTTEETEPGLIKINVDYDCDLSPDTCVRLQIAPETTVSEIITAVIAEVNSSLDKNDEFSSLNVVDEFSLTVELNCRVRVLNYSFQPLKVQNPWTKGKLSVKRKSDICPESP